MSGASDKAYPPHAHSVGPGPFVCHDTGREPQHVFTDHARPGVYNACEHCHDDKRTVGQRLADLDRQRAIARR